MASTTPTGPADTSVIWGVPHERNPHFVGRDEYLADVRRRLAGGDRVQVLHGLGGIGKTQAAVEFAHRYAADYTLVWWIPAQTELTVLAAYEKLAERLGQRLSPKAAPAVAVSVLAELLAGHRPLLVFDAAPDALALRPLLPPAEVAAHVIVTSRSPQWDGVAYAQPMRVLDRAESVGFLRRRTGLGDDGTGDDGRVAHNLGDLPLALEQAGAVIRQAGITYGGYLRRFETQWAAMLGEGVRPVDYPRSVAMTWGLAFAELERAAPAAADLLKLASFLGGERVPLSLLRDGAAALPPALAAAVTDGRLWQAAVAAVLTYALADADENGRAIGLHRLVGMVTRDRMDAAQQSAWAAVAVDLLSRTFRFHSGDVGSWAASAAVLPQVLDAAGHAERLGVDPRRTAELLNDAGRLLLKRGQYADARDVLARGYALLAPLVPASDPKLSAITNNVGRAYDRLGQTDAAIECYARVIAVDTAFYGEAHPHVAEVVNNYAICLQRKGDAAAAREQFARAVRIYEAHYGRDHPKLASMLNNLGYTNKAADPAAAWDQFARALSIAEATVGDRHPTTARILFNLADVRRRVGQPDQARALLERALDIDESALGPDHPDVAADRAALAAAVSAEAGGPPPLG